MEYIANDGTILVSKPNEEVTYTCSVETPDGIYESFETQGAGNEIGIKQIKIKRVVNDGICIYTITESTDEELITYKQTLITE